MIRSLSRQGHSSQRDVRRMMRSSPNCVLSGQTDMEHKSGTYTYNLNCYLRLCYGKIGSCTDGIMYFKY